VMLSHENLAWTSEAMGKLVENNPEDRVVSYLPLSHIAEQMMTIHGPATNGGAVYFAESIDKLSSNLKEVQPTVMFGVPRIWEKFHAGVSEKLAGATGMKKILVDFTRRTATEVSNLRNRGEEPGFLLSLRFKIADKLVLSKLKPALGLGSARVCVSGAAPIAPEILEFFASLDIVICEVYGQSEDTGPTTFNHRGKTKFGTVGPRIPGVEVKIAEDGEILIKGKNVFMGYFKEEKATDEALIDGWLYSGDLGSFDSEGFLTITGRKKDIIITAGGKNVAPKNIEAALKNSELIDEAVVIGDRRKFLSALLVPDFVTLEAWASNQGIPPGDRAALLADSKVQQLFENEVERANEELAKHEKIRAWDLLPNEFTIESGELTPTQKIKRRVINQKYGEIIEQVYRDAEAERSA